MKALILVDLQNDFLPGGTLAVAHGDEVIPVANRVQKDFELIVATRDWHPKNHGSFAANHPGRKVHEVIDLNGLLQVLWPVHCVQNTSGADFSPTLDPSRVAQVFLKGIDPDIDSYSGFYDNGYRRATGMGDWLKGRGVSEIVVLGLATDYCVKFTVLDAIQKLNFKTTLVEDGCRGVEIKPGDSQRAVDEMKRAGANVVTSASIAK